MRILILDDQRQRHERFAADLAGHDVTHCYFFSDYCNALANHGPFDVVFLDHDLGDMVEQETIPGSDTIVYDGKDAAAELIAMPSDSWPRCVVVHSWNGWGAKEMATMLEKAGLPDVRLIAFGGQLSGWCRPLKVAD